MNQNTLKHTFLSVLAAAAAAVAVFSCDKPYELDLPLAVTNHNLTLQKTAGSTHILIYADGPWTAGFTHQADWASLNKLSGEGNHDIVLSYSANYGVSRMIGIVLTKGELRDTIKVTQKGNITEGSLTFENAAVSLLKSSADISSTISTNIKKFIHI